MIVVLTIGVLTIGVPSLRGSSRFAARGRADSTVTHDAIARLQARIDGGEVVLAHDSTLGFLPALLRALDIPASSQGLVFSRTSLQTDKIAPWSPRAMYFNDDVYVAYVRESAFLEIAAVDPKAGAVFYTLSQQPGKRPVFAREGGTCLMCHQSRGTGNVPGFMVRSTIADRNGYPVVGVHEGLTTDETPVRERFGGYYVTGTHGSSGRAASGHAGNVHAPVLSHEVTDKQAYRHSFDVGSESARLDLAGKFDPSTYLAASSDIVALMVLVHQANVHNMIASVHEASRDVDLTDNPVPVRLQTAVEQLVRGLLFVNEAKLDGPMRGTTSFAKDFARHAVRDAKGRSLRDFDLERRLFRYPLSFLVYSESFDALSPVAHREVYRRLREILTGADKSATFAELEAGDRAAILEILDATKPDFRATKS